MRWTRHVEGMGRGEVYKGFWWRNMRERNNLEDTGVDWRVILRWMSRKFFRGMDWIDLAQGKDRWWGSCEYGNEPSGSTKCEEFFSWGPVSFPRTLLHEVRK
jgi:hypothetical protein